LRAPLADSAGVRERALTALLAAAQDSHPHVRINAVGLLPAYRQDARVTPVLIAALDAPDVNVGVAAAQALGLTNDASATAALRTATGAHAADGLRTTALHSLMRIDTAAGTSLALAWADSTRWLLRMHAARALTRAVASTAAP